MEYVRRRQNSKKFGRINGWSTSISNIFQNRSGPNRLFIITEFLPFLTPKTKKIIRDGVVIRYILGKREIKKRELNSSSYNQSLNTSNLRYEVLKWTNKKPRIHTCRKKESPWLSSGNGLRVRFEEKWDRWKAVLSTILSRPNQHRQSIRIRSTSLCDPPLLSNRML